MKRLTFFLFFIPVGWILYSCHSKRSGEVHAKVAQNHQTIPDLMNPRNTVTSLFTFDEMNFVFADTTESTILDTLIVGFQVFIDSVYYVVDGDGWRECMDVNYINNGKIGRGVMNGSSLSAGSLRSQKDTSIIYLGNFILTEPGFREVRLKAVRNGKTLVEKAVDTVTSDITYLELVSLDSVRLSNTYELIYLHTYYPACGYMSTHSYVNYTKGSFNLILQDISWADAPYYNSPVIYFPTVLNKKNLLYDMWDNYITRDENGRPKTYRVPDSLNIPVNQLIYIERWENTDSVVNGEVLLDEYQEPLLFDIISDRKLYRWNGTQLEDLSIK